MKNALHYLCLSTFFLDWVDVNSNIYVYTHMQLTKFSRVHLVAGGRYLDCSRGFVPKVEEVIYNNLVSCTPEVIELEEEPEKNIPALPPTEKDVASVKGKGKDRKVVAHA